MKDNKRKDKYLIMIMAAILLLVFILYLLGSAGIGVPK